MELIEDVESEDELPAGWEERVTPEGRVYYANHQTRSTQWQHPITMKEKLVNGELPYGWEKIVVDEKILFVDHLNKKTSYTDPRLAFAKTEKNINLSKMNFSKNFNENSTALDIVKSRDLTGWNAIVTGANRGIGLEITRALSYTGCYVIMACRKIEEGIKAAESLKKNRPDIKLEVADLDLSDLKSVKIFAEKINLRKMTINMLYLNAAVFETEYALSKDNIEIMFQVNYLSQFYLARLLISSLLLTKNSRIIVMSCESHRGGDLNKSDISSSHLNISKADFSFLQAFCNSKLCCILFANEMNRRLSILNYDINCKSCHPGNLLPSKLFHSWNTFRVLSLLTNRFSKSLVKIFLFKNLIECAAVPVYLGTESKLSRDCFYWNNFSECNPSAMAKDAVLAYRIWEISENILIDRTSTFDNFLAIGDKLSSYTLTESGSLKSSSQSELIA